MQQQQQYIVLSESFEQQKIAERRLKKMAFWGIPWSNALVLACLARMIALIVVEPKRENLLIPSSYGNEGLFIMMPFVVAALALAWGSSKMFSAIASKPMSQIAVHDNTNHGLTDINPYNSSRLFLAASTVLFAVVAGVLLGNPHQDAGKVAVGTLSILSGLYAAAMAFTPAVVNGWRASRAPSEGSNQANRTATATPTPTSM